MHHAELTRTIIGAAIEVHRQLGPGLLEGAYEACLLHELLSRGIVCEQQVPIPVIYKQIAIDCGFRLDLLVDRKVIVELKAVEQLHATHEAQILTYLKLSGHRLGLLINFNVPVLHTGVKRFVMS